MDQYNRKTWSWSSGMKAVSTRRAMIWGWCYSSRQISQQHLLLRGPKRHRSESFHSTLTFSWISCSASGCHLLSQLVKYLNRGRGLLKVQGWFLTPSFTERNMAEAGANGAASILMRAINEIWRWGDGAWTNMGKQRAFYELLPLQSKLKQPHVPYSKSKHCLEAGNFHICSQHFCPPNHLSFHQPLKL